MTDVPLLWDTTGAASAFDPRDWHAHSAAAGRPPPRLPALAVLTVVAAHLEEARESLGAAGHPYRLLEHGGHEVAVVGTAKGSAAAGVLDEVLALGARAVVFAGGCGALAADLAPGTLVAPTEALRDEGVSFHYAPPARWASASAALAAALRAAGATPVRSWTTGAHFRQSLPRLHAFRAEGCAVVENEAASLFAVGAFRGAQVAAVVAVGDSIASGRFAAPLPEPDVAAPLLAAAVGALAAYASAGQISGSA